MGTYLIIAILAVIVLFSIKSSAKHFNGEGGCCGGGSEPKPKKKSLRGPKVAEKIIYIEGMHCENCKNSVEKYINQIDGAVAKVNLHKKIAVVTMDRMISDGELLQAVKQADYVVTKIELQEE